MLAEEREKLERKTSAFELKLAKLSGAVDVLRGAQPPPPAKFPTVKAWSEDMIYHESEIVAFDGGTYQAQRDTARAPGTRDWICLALAGAGFTVRGTYDCQSALDWDPLSASKRDAFERRVLAVALAPSELAGVAETARARAGT